ncbi:MAG: glycerophosphodiester phosphodiesterase [Desulfobacteraceae bacterium]|nr:glycerophosphodiester phosphodiesterase [Desulfobacteraceae bacterium]MBC2750562.1 glycerophosphodiester phosphodiesterase [Desulfobacteraceae bacterium]
MVMNIAHRGARSLAPENTLLAARRGLEAGADLWETDLAVTRDEALILFHDDRLVRTTDVQQRFPDRAQDPFTTFSLAEIRTLDAGTWFVETDPHGQIAAGVLSNPEQQTCKGLQVPTLEEALVFTRDAGWKLNLELKFLPAPMADFPVVPQVLAMFDRVGIGEEQILISSFNHVWLTEARERRPALEIQALVGYYTDRPLDWGDLSFHTYNARHTLIRDEDILQRKQEGHAINLFTVNEEADMRRFMALGVDGIITDFPQRLAMLCRNEVANEE